MTRNIAYFTEYLIDNAASHIKDNPVKNGAEFPIVAFGYCVMWGIPAIFLFLLNAPQRLSLNLDERSYTFQRGYAPFVRIISGSFGDIENLKIASRYQSSSMQTLYSMTLVWKRHLSIRKQWVILGTTYDKQEAERLMHQYATALNVRLVHNP